MKRISISLIFIFLILLPFLGIIFAIPAEAFSFANDSLTFQEFREKVMQTRQEGDLDDYVYVETQEDLENLCDPVFKNVKMNKSASKNEIDEHKLQSFCKNNDYVATKEGDGYNLRNKYSLKTILVEGKVENTYNASTFITGYKNKNVLFYDTIEETKIAYQSLIQNQELIVVLDRVVEIDDFEQAQIKSGLYESWGKDTMDLDVYNQYLQTNNINKDVVVAVLDTGICTSHPAFENRLLKSSGRVVGDSYYTSTYTYSGYTFEDDKGHGTHVAGIICDITPSNVKILPIKVLNNEGKGYLSDSYYALESVYEEYSNQYQVVSCNLSLGAECDTTTEASYENAFFESIFKSLKGKGILSAVSAGNEKKDTSYISPGGCKEGAVVVSALAQGSGTCYFDSSYSNFGESVDISAPGTYVVAPYINPTNSLSQNYYATLSGTSMAAPHVAGAIALLCLDKNYYTNGVAGYTGQEIENRLLDCAVDLGTTGKDIYYGYGMLNLKNHDTFISYEAKNCDVTYDGQYHNITVSVNNAESYTVKYGLTSGVYNITDITTNDTFKNFTNGAINIYFEITSPSLNTAYGVGKLNIRKAQLSATLENQEFEYGGSIDQTKYSLSGQVYSGDQLGLSIYSPEASGVIGAGTYSLKASITNQNYNLVCPASQLKVNKRPLKITLDEQSFVYGNALNIDSSKYKITDGSLVSGDQLGLVITTVEQNVKNVGSYQLKVESYSNKNYEITAENGTLKITQRPLTIKLNPQSSMFGEQINLNARDFTVTIGSMVEGDDLGLVIATDANYLQVGEYDIEFISYSNTNYDLTVIENKYTVEIMSVEIVCNNQEFVYGENFNFNDSDFSIISGSVREEDALNLKVETTASSTSKVGEYEITFDYTQNTNYKFKITNGKVIIKPRTLKISIPEQRVTYGETVRIDNVRYTLVGGSIVNNDIVNISLSTTATSGSDAGEYDIIGTSSNENYVAVLDNAKFIIDKRPISVEITKSSIYGNAISALSGYKIVSGNIITGDSLNLKLATAATNRSDVGDYSIYVDYCNSNYNVSVRKGVYTITQRPLNISISYQEGRYGDRPNLNQKAFSILSGLITGDDPKIVLTTNATHRSTIGTYAIFASCQNGNYKVSTSKLGNYSVVPRPIKIRLTQQNIGYSFSIKYDKEAYEIMEGSLVNGDDLKLTIFAKENMFGISGSYGISAVSDNINYDVTIVDGHAVIEFSAISFMIIFFPVCLIAVVGIVVWLIRRKHNRNKYLKDDF